MLTEFFDTQQEARLSAVSVAASFGHVESFVLNLGNGYGGNWLCKFGPSGCVDHNARFQYYSAYYCSSGQRYAPALKRCVPVVDIDRRHKADDCNAARGNPIYPLTGVKKETVDTGLTIGALPLVLTYSSANQLPMESGTEGFEPVSAPDARAQGLGPVWTTTLHRKLVRGADGVVVGRGDGSTTSFIGTLPADADVADQLDLTTSPMRYVDVNRNALELYDSNENGRLKGIEWASGERIEATYSGAATPLAVAPAPGYLIRVADNRGRSISFEYALPFGANAATGGLLSKIIDPNGKAIPLAPASS